MAKKCEWNGKPAYEEGPLILQQNEEGKWIIFHSKSKSPIMGFYPYKQKRDALRYAQNLIVRLDMNFETKEQMLELNGGIENCNRLRNEAYWEGKEDG